MKKLLITLALTVVSCRATTKVDPDNPENIGTLTPTYNSIVIRPVKVDPPPSDDTTFVAKDKAEAAPQKETPAETLDIIKKHDCEFEACGQK